MQETIVKGVGKCPKLPWMIEFHSTANGKVLNNQLKAAFADNYLEHMSTLHEKSKVRRKRLTQFSVVIPPRASMERIEEFLKAGMTIALLKMELFTVEEFQGMVEVIKKANEEFGKKLGRVYPLGIGLEISEPEILTGKLQKPLTGVEMKKGQPVKITSDPEYAKRGGKDHIYVGYSNISNLVHPGDSLILGNGEIRISALEIARDIINGIVEKAGLLTDNLSVKLPNVPVIMPETDSQIKLKQIGELCEIDIIFVSPGKIDLAKQILGPTVLIFVKMEYACTVEIFDEIVPKADGILLDGEKLVLTSNENVFILQKSLIARCNKLGKPVISFINCHSITKSAVNDIANTVIDGIDGLLVPPDPELIESISLVCKAAESATYQKQLFDNLTSVKPPPIEPIISLAMAAVEASFKCNAAAIILLTTSGRSAKLVSMYRPRCPIIALTRFGRIAKQLMVYKGVIPIFYTRKPDDTAREDMEKNMQLGMTFGKINGYIKMGDAVVIVFGTKNNVGFRNCLEIVYASECDTVIDEAY